MQTRFAARSNGKWEFGLSNGFLLRNSRREAAFLFADEEIWQSVSWQFVDFLILPRGAST
jgi:hypothetical protein